MSTFSRDVLALDPATATQQMEEAIRTQVLTALRRRGAVVALSGGIDSSVVTCLCARALGAGRVLALLMPEKLPPDTSKLLLCPMPGLVVRIDVAEGDEVFDGQPLAMVEAMKMENVLRAERRARVAKIRAAPGDSLAVDDVILEFE